MKTILITGRMGVGKSELIAFLKKKSYPVFIADEVAKKLLHPENSCYKRLKKLFLDPHFYQKDGSFHKKKLAQVLFKNPEKKKAMEQIIHPKVRELFKEYVKKESQSPYLFYEAPLISKGILKSCDFSILVISPYEKQKERLLKLGWSYEEIKERWEAQIPDTEIRKEVDFIIENKKDKLYMQKQLLVFLEKLKKEE